MLPVGSGNDFCKTAGYTRDVDSLIKKIYEPQIHQIDLGFIQFNSSSANNNINRYFISSAGIGFDGLVAKLSNRKSVFKGLILYLSSVILALNRFNAIDIEGAVNVLTQIKGKKFLIALGNGRTSGGGFLLTPDAKLNDGLIDICIAEDIPKRRVFTLLPKAINGTHIQENEIFYSKFETLKLKIKTGFIMHFDGEVEECEPGFLNVNCCKGVISILK